jgi:hypothetical protein
MESPQAMRTAGYVSGTEAGETSCAICGHSTQGQGAVVFVKDHKTVCRECVGQIRNLMDSRAFLPFWE